MQHAAVTLYNSILRSNYISDQTTHQIKLHIRSNYTSDLLNKIFEICAGPLHAVFTHIEDCYMHCSYPCTVLTHVEDCYMHHSYQYTVLTHAPFLPIHRSYQYTVLTHAPFLPMLRTTLMTCKEEEASVMELVVIVL